jgi:putative serine protease PepD
MVLATALLAAGIGGGVGALVADRGQTATTSLSSSSGNAAAPVSLPTGSVESAAAKVLPSVVSITERATDGSGGEGTGIILSADGLILTNNHVVADAASGGTLQVTLGNNTTVDATIVGRDPSSDLAVVKAKGVSGLTPATLGSSSSLVVGETVVAVGSPLGLSGTVTSGIVSALDRPVTTQQSDGGQQQDPFGGQSQSAGTQAVLDAIQTDAAINPGNSGGPLVDLAGRVVGINSAIASLGNGSGGQSGSIGVGFAIPIDQAKRIAQQLIDTGKATHPQLGVSVSDATTTNGALLQAVTAGGPADKAGLKAGDVVTKVGGKNVDSANALIAHIRSEAPGATVSVTYVRDGKAATTQVTLGQSS